MATFQARWLQPIRETSLLYKEVEMNERTSEMMTAKKVWTAEIEERLIDMSSKKKDPV